jgi:hypothetical protein
MAFRPKPVDELNIGDRFYRLPTTLHHRGCFTKNHTWWYGLTISNVYRTTGIQRKVGTSGEFEGG